MKNLSFLIKPASSLCNLKCKYCFYADVSEHRDVANMGIMNSSTLHKLIDCAFDNLDSNGVVTFAFQGGEPVLAGINYFKEFTDYANSKKGVNQKISYAIQTNGTLIDEEWVNLFKENHFLVGISLDGYKENHNYFRLTSLNKESYSIIMKNVELLKKNEVDFNILTVLTRQLAKHPLRLYDFYVKNDFKYVQLIPCLKGLDDEEDSFSLTPELFADFYKKFYDLWLKDFRKGNYRSFNLFDNLLLMLSNQMPYQCGLLGFCSLQLVVEGDGSVYPCDFYVLDKYKGGNLNTDSLDSIMKNMRCFVEEKKKMSPLCSTCHYIKICHGNCKRMNNLYFGENYCGYQEFLKHAIPSMIEISRRL